MPDWTEWQEAGAWCMPFGIYYNKCLADIAKDDAGLLYLAKQSEQDWPVQWILTPIRRFLCDAAINDRLEKLLKTKGTQ